MDTTAIPGNDFTQYVNGTWMKNTKIPADKSSYGVGAMVNDKAQEDVKSIDRKRQLKAAPKAGTEEQKIGDDYESYMNMKVRDSIGLAPLNDEFKKVDAIASAKDLAAYFAYAGKTGQPGAFGIGVLEDFKDPKNICCTAGRAA